ncbi:MAG: hypothetical protein GKR88_20405 [Flavobacteriaceae bacterium]|nr:MAG: hypothetical protein GKR88_20405 [Flavobacteriaceae bacterium]
MENTSDKIASFIKYYFEQLTSLAGRWVYIVLTLCVMIGIYLYFRWKSGIKKISFKDALSFLFPKKIYLHKSAILGYKFYLIDPIIRLLFFNRALQIPISAFIFVKVQLLLVTWLGEPAYEVNLIEKYPIFFAIVFMIITIWLKELGFYFHHYLMHKVPFLWEFHKVHHSAKVLTPLTDWRNHPVDLLTMLYFSSILLGTFQAFADYFLMSNLSFNQIIGFNVILFGYYSIAYHLRHTHLWLSFGKYLNHIFMSPSQHQLHHSIDERHHDKNFGSALSFWDWVFGSLYVAKLEEKLEFGLTDDSDQNYTSLWMLYSLPFIKNHRAGRSAQVFILLIILLFFMMTFWITVINNFILYI